jgi:hypothetical protein
VTPPLDPGAERNHHEAEDEQPPQHHEHEEKPEGDVRIRVKAE